MQLSEINFPKTLVLFSGPQYASVVFPKNTVLDTVQYKEV